VSIVLSNRTDDYRASSRATSSLQCVLPQLNKGQSYTVRLTVHVNAVAGTTLSNTATTVSSMQDFVPANNKGTLTTKVN
jgi:hypothetical protein